ncbi:Transcriptional activator protein ExaE [Beijerinckiaceae bacterium RH AL1]|jgi:two-component system, NarL family, invasion response regulator UvrY|nr:response regulator transcription factor [Beijerinckiaceae bacterium]VVB43174.1 Transcriptional activator protein ExaE [Beijerinckiaceae bacterium RH AL8]VVB43189.1 Transcriptional activator protein ExaE [Beijerinckiaceae bacterium RH CH11]VVC53708.1 Transcriptional activator protein ExaE [Beijerinckiaceae bacterium RH AL1]
MKLLLVDDHAVVREGVRRLLSVSIEATLIEAQTGREALTVFRAEKPEVVILDLNLPGSGGLDLLRRLLIEDPKTKVLIFSMHTTPLYVARALQAGAKGYISKSAGAEELVEAIRTVMAGGKYVERELAADLAVNVLGSDDSGKPLSPRELDIMRLLAKGKGLSEIADALGISYKTVANTCTSIKHKLLVDRTSDLIRLAVEMHAS